MQLEAARESARPGRYPQLRSLIDTAVEEAPSVKVVGNRPSAGWPQTPDINQAQTGTCAH